MPQLWPLWADQKLRATPEQLSDALGACTDFKPIYRRLLLPQRPFLSRNVSPRGWAPAPVTKRAQAWITVTDLRRATVICGAFLIRVATPPQRPKEVSSRLFIAVSCRAWDTIKLSARLPIGSVDWSGWSYTKESVTRNEDQSSTKDRSNSAPREWSANSANSVTQLT